MAKLQLPTFRHLFASTFSFVKIEMPRRGECEETLSLLAGIGSGCCVALELLAEVARASHKDLLLLEVVSANAVVL